MQISNPKNGHRAISIVTLCIPTIFSVASVNSSLPEVCPRSWSATNSAIVKGAGGTFQYIEIAHEKQFGAP
jgi:hypothetical protein